MITQKVLFVLTISLFKFGENSFYDDYCWRDYDEDVPSDAIIGGMDSHGQPIYIGQAVYDYKLLPGKILTNDKNCYITDKEEHAVNESVQILCSQRPDKFEWLPVFYNQVKNLRNKRPLEGGYEKGFHTYIGRVLTDKEITVSKVTCWASTCEKLLAMNNGVTQEYEMFDLLVSDVTFKSKESD